MLAVWIPEVGVTHYEVPSDITTKRTLAGLRDSVRIYIGRNYKPVPPEGRGHHVPDCDVEW